MFEIFLIAAALVWLVAAAIHDVRKDEVMNWLNFSLLGAALAYRAFFSVMNWDATYILFGIAGALMGYGLANAFYYTRIWGGGDVKLFMALGAVVPFSINLQENLMLFGGLVFLILLTGAVYGILWSIWLAAANFPAFRKRFAIEYAKRKGLVAAGIIFGLMFAVLALLFYSIGIEMGPTMFALLAVMVVLFPLLLIYAKAVEESCLIKMVNARELVPGDWLAKAVRVGKIKIKPGVHGLDESELRILKKAKKKVLVKQGIPFAPVFLISFGILAWLWRAGYFGLVFG